MAEISKIGLGGANPKEAGAHVGETSVGLRARAAAKPEVMPQTIIAELEKFQGREGINLVKIAFERVGTVPALDRLWKDQKPISPERLKAVVAAAAPFIETIQTEEARVNWEALGWIGPKPSEFLQARLNVWQGRGQGEGRGRG